MSKRNFTFKNSFVCDDVRREDNGKLIFIGVYEQDILVLNFPAALALRPVILGTVAHAGQLDLEVKCELDDKILVSGKAGITLHKSGNIMLPIPALPMKLEHAGALKISIKSEGEDWAKVWVGQIRQPEPPQSVLA